MSLIFDFTNYEFCVPDEKRFTLTGFKEIEIRKFYFVAKI